MSIMLIIGSKQKFILSGFDYINMLLLMLQNDNFIHRNHLSKNSDYNIGLMLESIASNLSVLKNYM